MCIVVQFDKRREQLVFCGNQPVSVAEYLERDHDVYTYSHSRLVVGVVM